MNFVISKHCIDRYRERWAPWLTEQAARDSIEDQVRRAHFVRAYPDGDEVWRAPNPLNLKFVLQPKGNYRIVLTVLSPYRGAHPPRDERLVCGQKEM